jgi:hypothetical protein
VWLAREQDLEQRRSTVLRAIETLEVRRSAERAAMGALMTQGWRPPVALALVAALTGLGLDAGAVAVGWRGWSILALLWALVSLVLPGVPAVVTAGAAGARAFIANLGARRQARRLAGEIAACRRDRTTAAERRRRLQSWIAASSELVLSEYRVQRERGGRAGTLAMESLV